VNLDRLGDKTVPILSVSVPELLLECLVREPLVFREAKFEGEAARRAVRVVDLEARNFECLEAVGEDERVGGLDEVVDFGRRLLED
jgi:hypothetical protein